MNRAALVLLLIPLTFCSSRGGTQSTAAPGHGAIHVAIEPNPVVAINKGGNTYEFAFDVIVSETGGRPVRVDTITVDVYALGGIRVGAETYNASQITAMGYSPAVAANQTVRYHITERRGVPDQRLFSSVNADVHVFARDDTGTATTADTVVTVTVKS